MSLRKSITISLILLVVLFVFFEQGERVKRGSRSYLVVERIELGEGRSILIMLDDEPFETAVPLYEIHVNGQVVVPTTFISGCRPSGEGEFEVLSTRDNNVFALIWTKNPGVIVVAYDFATRASWPRGEDPYDWKIGLRPGGGLLDLLQAEYPQMKLTLS
jgi:hypothetical protein